MEIKRILRNAIQTPDGTVLESKHRHDYVTHIDKNGQWYMVDGGGEYLRRGYDVQDFVALSVYDDGTHETRRNNLRWGKSYDKDMNSLPKTIYPLISEMDTDHIEAILDGGYARNNAFYIEVFTNELEYRKNGETSSN